MYGLILAAIGITMFTIACAPWRFRWSKQDWVRLFRVYVFVSIPFVLLDSISHGRGWWSYASEHTSDIAILGLPLEECLFFFVVPFACLVLYSCLASISSLKRSISLRPITAMLGVIAVAALAFTVTQPLERTIVDAVLLCLIIVLFILLRPHVTGAFAVWFGAIILLFVGTNSILTGLPIVLYDHAYGSMVRVGAIPLEDFWYNLSLLLSAWLVWTRRGQYQGSAAGRQR